MIRFFPRAFAPLCFLLAANSGCARAQETLAPTAATPAVAASPDEPIERATLQDKAVDELSGLAASRQYPGLLWGHNDSGDSARIFAINERGETVATVNFSGLDARDWEDIDVAGGWIYVGEIGDNNSAYPNIKIYRLHEPDFNPDKLGQNIDLQPKSWEAMTLHYPGGARDAESLVATPDGHFLIISKDQKGSNFYTLGQPFKNGQTANLDEIFDKVPIGETGWLTRLVTGADLSPDGRQLSLTTYAQLWQYDLARPFDFSSLQIKAPHKRDLPPLRQCESVCYSANGKSLWVSSEGKNAPLYELPAKINSTK